MGLTRNIFIFLFVFSVLVSAFSLTAYYNNLSYDKFIKSVEANSSYTVYANSYNFQLMELKDIYNLKHNSKLWSIFINSIGLSLSSFVYLLLDTVTRK